MIHSIRIIRRVLQFVLPTEFKPVYRQSVRVSGRKVVLYSTDPAPGQVAALGAWTGGAFMTEDSRLAKVIRTVAKGL